MNKQDLVEALSARLHKSQREASETIDALVDEIKRALEKGEAIRISGFGAFEQTMRSARQGRNPRTGEPVRIAPTRAVRFRPAADFKAIVAGTKRAVAAAVPGVDSGDSGAEARPAAEAAPAERPAAKRATAAKRSTAKRAVPAKRAAARTTAPVEPTTTAEPAVEPPSPAERTAAQGDAPGGVEGQPAAPKPTAARAVPARKTATAKKAAVKKTAAKKAAAKKAAAKKAAVKKTAAKKAAVKKTAAKRSPAKRAAPAGASPQRDTGTEQ